MMIKRLFLSLFLIFLYGSYLSDIFASDKKHILIVSSYSHTETWSTSIAKTLKRSIESDTTGFNIVANIEYLGAEKKNSAISTRFGMQKVFSHYSHTPDLMIFIGDEAWIMYRIMILGDWADIPVVLCNVRDELISDYTQFFRGKKIEDKYMIPLKESSGNIYFDGVIIGNVVNPTIELMIDLNRDLEEIVYVSRGSYQDVLMEKYIKEALNRKYENISIKILVDNEVNTDSIITSFKDLGPKQALLFNQWYSKLYNIKGVTPEISDLLKNGVKVPAFSFIDYSSKDSLLIGGVFPTQQCIVDETLNMVYSRLNNMNRESSFVTLSNTINLDKSSLDYKKIKLITLYKDVNLQNLPPTFFQRYRRVMFFTLIIIVVVLYSYFTTKRIRKFRAISDVNLKEYMTLYEEFILVFENMPVGIWIFDKNWKLVRKNPEGAKVRKKILSEDEQSNDSITIANYLSAEDKEAIMKGEPIDRTIPFVDMRNGANDIIYFRIIVSHPLDHIMLIAADVTKITKERVEKENISNMFQFSLEKSKMGIAEYNMLNGEGYATDGWYRNLNIKKNSDYVNRFVNVCPEDMAKIQTFLSKSRVGLEDTFGEVIRINSQSETHWLRYYINVIKYNPDNKEIILREMSWNIDKQKHREVELMLALKKAKESESMKNSFIANMSAEIKTPMDKIVKLADSISSEKYRLDAKMRLMIELHESNDRLLQIILDILELSRVESGTIEITPQSIDIHQLLEDYAEQTRRKIERKGSDITVITEFKGGRTVVYIDEERVGQILDKFLSNAVKYTKSGKIKIGCAVSGNQLYVFVEDTGIGIPEGKRKYIFNRFSTQDYVFRDTGLGLQISKSLIDKMNGTIGFTSEVSEGSTFWFRIPVSFVENKV